MLGIKGKIVKLSEFGTQCEEVGNFDFRAQMILGKFRKQYFYIKHKTVQYTVIISMTNNFTDL